MSFQQAEAYKMMVLSTFFSVSIPFTEKHAWRTLSYLIQDRSI